MQKNLYKIGFGNIKFSVITHNQSFGQSRQRTTENFSQELRRTHIHPYYELFISVSGSVEVITEKKSFTCRNSILIIPPELPHYAVFNNSSALNVNFSVSQEADLKRPIGEVLNSKLSENIITLPLNNTVRFYVEQILRTINSAVSEYEKHLLLSLIFLHIFSPLVPNYERAESDVTVDLETRYNHYITKLGAYINQNINKKIVLADLANELNICTKQVARIIKKEYQCTLSELVTRYRINVAVMLLKNTDMRITDIATTIGYTSPINFHKHFKEINKMTPTEYRHQTRDNQTI